MEQMQKKNNFGRLVGGIVLLGIIAGTVFGFFNRQAILDRIALHNYTPNQQVVSVANDTTMRDSTRRVFYVNHPEFNDKATFRANCPSQEQSIVLGCFVNHKGIYVLNVTDDRLSGVMQVTAAHETLHAEYARLSKSQKSHVDQMTASFFATVQDERIKKTIEQYRKQDPSVVPNELHSILGTEVRNLSPELESYYGQYFNERAQVVSFSEKYEQTFVDLNDQVDAYDEQLKTLKDTIDASQTRIDQMGGEIERRKTQLDSLSSSSQTEAYNDAVPGFNQKVREYNSLITDTKNDINDYNALVEKRNSIVVTEQGLVKAIDSSNNTKQTE